jgi:hypothetical protein
MKQGASSIVELAQRLEADRAAQKDLISDTRSLRFIRKPEGSSPSPEPRLLVEDHGDFKLTDVAHRQIADRLNIPAKYYERLRMEQPDMLDWNVNELLRRVPERRMVRTMHDRARAFLSDRYRRLDNWQVAESVLPVLEGIPDLQIASCEITERRLYLKAVFPRITGEVKRGDVVQAGVVIQNSEIGFGATSVERLVYRLVCENGMISPGTGTRRHHVGKNLGGNDEGAFEVYRDETIRADDKAFMLKIEDTVRAQTNETEFHKLIGRLRDASTEEIKNDPLKAVEALSNTFQLQEAEKSGVLQNLIRGGDLSRWGMVNAVTQTANTADNYDRATELEKIGGQVLDLPSSSWRSISLG